MAKQNNSGKTPEQRITDLEGQLNNLKDELKDLRAKLKEKDKMFEKLQSLIDFHNKMVSSGREGYRQI